VRRLVIVTAIPVLGVIAGVIFNAFIPQPYQSTTVVHLGPGGIGPRAQARAAESDPSFLYADRILGQHDLLALRRIVVARLMAGRVVFTANVTGNPVAAEQDAAAVAHGYLRYLSCGWPGTGSCRPIPSGTRVHSYPAYVLPSIHQVPAPWVRFGLYGLVAGLLVGFLVQLAFLAHGLVRLISGRVKRPVHQLP
jgi:hypothetical protein